METFSKNELDSRDFLLKEFDQAWNHYRHLENIRFWLLGFLFTVALGAVGWIAKILSEPSFKDKLYIERVNTHFYSMLIAAAVCVIGIIIYVKINRMLLVQNHYADVWRFIRRKFYNGDNKELRYILDIYENKTLKKYFATDTRTTNWMIWAIIILSWAYLIFGAIWIVQQEIFLGIFIAVVTLLLILFAIFVIIHIQHIKREIKTESKSPGPLSED